MKNENIIEYKDPVISVLIPVFKPNVEWLKEAVCSILYQSYSNFEILVLFEGDEKKEETESLVKSLRDSRIKLIEIPSGAGLSKCLNIGIEESKGKYLARMDADDYSIEYRFEKQLSFMERNKDVAVVGTATRVMGKKAVDFIGLGLTPEIRKIRMLFMNAGIAHPTAFIRKSFLDHTKIRYNESIAGSEDYHLWVDVMLSGGSISQIRKPLLEYRKSENQASVRKKTQMLDWDMQAKSKILQRIGFFSEDEKEVLRNWEIYDEKCNPDDCVKFIINLRMENTKSHFYDEKLLRRESTFLYIKKGVLYRSKVGDRLFFKLKYIKQIFVIQDIAYIIYQLLCGVCTKVCYIVGMTFNLLHHEENRK